MIRYSFIVPYYARHKELHKTLNNLHSMYNTRSDIEIIIIEDSKNYSDEALHKSLVDTVHGWDCFAISIIQDPVESYNPAHKFTLGVEMACGETVILTNPEIVHLSNCLGYLDSHILTKSYIVFDCASVRVLYREAGNYEYQFLEWYEHDTIRRNLHFCSALPKDLYLDLGGMCEDYLGGIAFEDNDWSERVKYSGTLILNPPGHCVGHLEHDRSYSISKEKFDELYTINHKIWEKRSELIRRNII